MERERKEVVMINEWYDFNVCTPVRRYLKDRCNEQSSRDSLRLDSKPFQYLTQPRDSVLPCCRLY